MAGRGSLAGLLAYGNANEIVVEMAREVLPVVRKTPVLAGVNGTDPFMLTGHFLKQLGELGFSGVQNFPTVGLIDGTFRANLEETGMGYGLEVDMIRLAHDLDLLTTPYVFSRDETEAMVKAGADIIVCHMGLTTGGSIGAETALTLKDCTALINEWSETALSIREDVMVLCHGGPDRHAGRRELHPEELPQLPRLLRRLQHGAAADRDCAHRTDAEVQGDHPRLNNCRSGRKRPEREETMSGSTIGTIIFVIIVAAILIAIGVWLMNWLYRRSSKETSFVRTGLGGQRVVMNGGAFVLPIIHDIIPVNMNTLRLEVRRGRESALITKNRMRIDVVAEFYVRVQPMPDAIANAAQTLGQRTMQPEQLRELLEGKFVDSLRSVAAEMTMDEMHEKRGEYVKRVRGAVAEDLLKNGLELETVSLTGLDQTNMEFFNPSNAFDAEGLTRLTEEIERRKKIRNDIEQDTMIQIRNKNLEAEKLSLEIDQESEHARLQHERELEMQRAVQRSELARERALREQEAEQAQIVSRLEVEKSRITVDRELDEERIKREQGIQTLEVERRKALELAEQDRAIAIAQASKAQSEAQAAAETARAKAVSAEEKVFSARETEVAERRKTIELIGASQDAERQAIRVRVEAEAEKSAASDRSAARRIEAEGEAESEKIRALASRLRYEIEAEGNRLLNEAQNVLTPESRRSAMRMKLLDKLEGIIRESVKPMEKIDGIKILQVDGLGGRRHRHRPGRGEFRQPLRQPGQQCAPLPRPGAAGGFAVAGDGAFRRRDWRPDQHAGTGRRRRRAEALGHGEGLHVECHRRAGGPGLGDGARLQRAAALASRHPRQPDRGQSSR